MSYPMIFLKHKFLLLFCLLYTIAAQDKPSQQEVEQLYQGKMSDAAFAKPNLNKGLVFDYGAILTQQQNNYLQQKLIAYNDSTGTQIVLFTIDELGKYDLELTAAKIGESWGVGQQEEDNGMVILISEKDRVMTIQGGYGMQAKMPATLQKIIIDQHFATNFRQGDYFAGINQGTDAIFAVLAGQYKAPDKQKDQTPFFAVVLFLVLFFLVFYLAIKFGGRGGRGNHRGGKKYRTSSWDDIIINNTGSRSWSSGSSWGGSGGSSGGFGGFGGGSFGGGGASGSW